MRLYPNAKINIGLNVGNTRADGYHNIETVFYPISLHDILDIEPCSAPTTFENDGIPVDCDSNDNLIMRTYNMLREQYPAVGNVHFKLTKHIPFGAGLGGGSSDASFTAKGLNEIFKLGLTEDELARIIKPVGADCPFFIYNRPMFAQGIGEQLQEQQVNLNGLYLVLVKPEVSIPTATAYREVPCQTLNGDLAIKVQQPIEEWKNSVSNAFETSVFPHYSVIADIKQSLYDSGAVYASMTGTGAAVYGLFSQSPIIPQKLKSYFIFEQQL